LYEFRENWYYLRMTPTTGLQHDFFRRLDYPWHLGRLFDYLPDTYFYSKDSNGRFMMTNEAIAKMLGARNAAEMIGKSDHDYTPSDLADQYVAEDHRVMRSGTPVINQAWIASDSRGALKWCLSTKIPLFGDGGRVIGVAGTMQDVREARMSLKPYHEMESVMAEVFARYSEKIDVPALARLTHLSLSQFERRFKKLFQMTPQQFVLRVRIHAACRLLVSTRESAARIALQTGFYDQSYFIKQFQKQMGITPVAYRKKYSEGIPPAEIAMD
jgi:PAS domain S-box-containing protein